MRSGTRETWAVLVGGGLALGLLIGAGIGEVAAAAERKITMVESSYAPARISAKVGDTLTFVNDDLDNHWVYVATLGHQISGGPQKPGQSFSLVVAKPGTFKVECAFHTDMGTTVSVTK